MASEIVEVRVGDLVDAGVLAINDGYRMRNEELGASGTPFVRGGDIGSGWIDHKTEDHIRPDFLSRIESKLTRPWDVAFITKGTVGRVGILRPQQPAVVFAPQVAYWRSLDHEKLNPRFIYYLLSGAEFQARLDADKTHGSMVADYVSLSQQLDFRLTIPGIAQQRAIAHVLGTLDDKIELNRKMSETLEELARTLFKSWFVDFDPVLAKAGGKKPFGMDDATAALFPDSFEDSDLGPIPSGWRVAALGEVAALNPEQWTSRNHPPAIDYLDLSSASRGVFGAPSRMSWGDSPSRARRVLRDWDTAFGTVRPGNRSFGLVLSASEVLTGSTGFAVLRPDDERWRGFVYLCVTRDANVEYFSVVADGSAYPAVAPEVVHQTSCVLPDDDVVSCFQRVVEPMFLRIDAATSESRTLAELRDTLLPKLLSGELRVPLDVADAPSAKSEQLGLFPQD